jgi:N-acetylmuramic acid 6-phosphate etherase
VQIRIFHHTAAMQSPNRVLGIEGGGTKTDWVLAMPAPAPESASPALALVPVQSGRLGPANLRLTPDPALSALFAALPSDPEAVGVCLAGCATDADRARLLSLAHRRWPDARIRVGSDRDSALAAAFGDQDGIVVMSGTGAAVHGRAGTRIEKAGGWGQLLGDRGSSYVIAMQGLRRVLSQYDLSQRVTPFARTLLETLHLRELQDLVQWAMQADKMSVARLAPCIVQAALAGEPEMLEVLQSEAGALAEFTRAVAGRLGTENPAVRLFGGTFCHHPSYVALFNYRLSVLLPKAAPELCTESGALGAAWLALRDAGSLPPKTAATQTSGPRIGPEDLSEAVTEQIHTGSAGLDRLSPEALVDLFLAEEPRVAQALTAARESLLAALLLVTRALENGGRLFYAGAGTSGRLGLLDAAEIPPTFGSDQVRAILAGGTSALVQAAEGAEDASAEGALTEEGLNSRDVVFAITASGRTPFALSALGKARSLGAGTILLSCNPRRAKTVPGWDVEIDLDTGPELLAGSTRLKAGSATKAALNLISTCTMVRLGRVRGNRMSHLRVTNVKLRERAVRTLVASLAVSEEEARNRLEATGWDLARCLAGQ